MGRDIMQSLDFDYLVGNGVVNDEKREDQFVTENGTKLGIQKVKGSIVRDIVMRLEEPKVPRVYIKEDDRWEENPSDPDYISAKNKYNLDAGMASIGAYLLFGTKLISKPDDVSDVDSDWHEDFEEFGIVIRKKGSKSRYLDWLKYVVMADDNEMFACVTAVMRYSGAISQDDVVMVESTFQGDEERISNTGISNS